MASNLTKRLDKIEKGIAQFLESQNPTGPVYVSEGETAPEGREAIVIAMQWVEAEHQVEDGKSLDGDTSHGGMSENGAQRKTPSTLPPSETVAERDKRWRKHLQAIDMRGERYTGDEPRDLRREDMRRGIV